MKKKDTGKILAMKVMNKTKISGQRQLQCLIAEKKIMLNDNHFLVHLHYSFQTEDKLYFVMDYISGGDLSFHLEKKNKFDEKEVRFISCEIILGLEHLHACGIVYRYHFFSETKSKKKSQKNFSFGYLSSRDLKLENVLLDKEGHVCLTDFGLSKELESVDATTKTVCGTPTYLGNAILKSMKSSS